LKRERILKNLKVQLKNGKYIIGVSTGSGMTAKYAQEGGTDVICVHLGLKAGGELGARKVSSLEKANLKDIKNFS
jgi:predicted TIM-barrel enzyme